MHICLKSKCDISRSVTNYHQLRNKTPPCPSFKSNTNAIVSLQHPAATYEWLTEQHGEILYPQTGILIDLQSTDHSTT